MRYLVLVGLLFSFSTSASEKDYQVPWCESQKGLSSGSIVTVRDQYTGKIEGYIDCLTATHAIEVDFGKKFHEGITQALYYAMYTGKRAGLLLIVSSEEQRFVRRAKAIVEHYGLPIDIWTVQK
jgi:hypothetical protein